MGKRNSSTSIKNGKPALVGSIIALFIGFGAERLLFNTENREGASELSSNVVPPRKLFDEIIDRGWRHTEPTKVESDPVLLELFNEDETSDAASRAKSLEIAKFYEKKGDMDNAAHYYKEAGWIWRPPEAQDGGNRTNE